MLGLLLFIVIATGYFVFMLSMLTNTSYRAKLIAYILIALDDFLVF